VDFTGQCLGVSPGLNVSLLVSTLNLEFQCLGLQSVLDYWSTTCATGGTHGQAP